MPETTARQLFQPICRRYAQFVQTAYGIEHPQLALCRPLDVYETPDSSFGRQLFRVPATEGLDHRNSITRFAFNVKRYTFQATGKVSVNGCRYTEAK